MDDLAKEWDVLRESLPDDHAEAAEILFDRCDLMADRIEALEAERESVVPLLEEVRGILSHYAGSTAAQDGTDCLEYKRDMACLDRVEWMIAHLTGIPR